MFTNFQHQGLRTLAATQNPAIEHLGDPVVSSPAAAPEVTPGLLALGADLKAYLDQPDQVSIGEFAALVERLQGEFQLICGVAELTTEQQDSIAALFADAQTREFSQSDIGQIEAVLRDLR